MCLLRGTDWVFKCNSGQYESFDLQDRNLNFKYSKNSFCSTIPANKAVPHRDRYPFFKNRFHLSSARFRNLKYACCPPNPNSLTTAISRTTHCYGQLNFSSTQKKLFQKMDLYSDFPFLIMTSLFKLTSQTTQRPGRKSGIFRSTATFLKLSKYSTHSQHKSYCCTVHSCRITSIINQQLHLYNFQIKHLKSLRIFRSYQIIIRELCSLLKLCYSIHNYI